MCYRQQKVAVPQFILDKFIKCAAVQYDIGKQYSYRQLNQRTTNNTSFDVIGYSTQKLHFVTAVLYFYRMEYSVFTIIVVIYGALCAHVYRLITRSEINYHQHYIGEDHLHHKNHQWVVKIIWTIFKTCTIRRRTLPPLRHYFSFSILNIRYCEGDRKWGGGQPHRS